MARLIDISPPIDERLAVWPGDVPYRRETSRSLEVGDPISLSAIRTTVHLGAHADAPGHCHPGGEGIGERALEPYYGPCQVIGLDLPRHERILPEHLPPDVHSPRLLFRTGSSPRPERFSEDFNALSPALVDWAHARGIVLLGIDTPSVDLFDDGDLPVHRALARRGLASLEGLVLSSVTAGHYTLVALPLRLRGADAAPVRAALIAP